MKYNTFTVTEDENSVKYEYPVGIEYLTFFGRYLKGLFKLSEQRIISEEFVDSGSYYQGVFNNSEEFPLVLHLDPKSRLYTASFLSYYSIIYYKDTGNVAINYTMKALGLSLKNNKAFKVKEDRYTLYIEKASGKPSMFLNKKLCYTNFSLHVAFQELFVIIKTPLKINPYLDVLRIALEEYFIPTDSEFTCDSSKLIALYRVKRSCKLLKDLPWRQEDLSSLYLNYNLAPENLAKQREKILVQLRKGNTKKATELCFYGNSFPKSIKSLVLKDKPLGESKNHYDKLAVYLKSHDINIIKSFYEVSPTYFDTLVECMDLGFSSKHVLNVAKNDLNIIRDTVRLARRLANETLEFNPNIFEYHDYLTNLENLRFPPVTRSRINLEALYETVDTSREYELFETEDLIFRSPKNANELGEVGQQLHICVGSYRRQFFIKALDIILITDKKDNYIGCLEIKNDLVVQAKLKYNKKIIEDAFVYKKTIEWMENAKVKQHTSDLSVRDRFKYINDCIPNEERKNLIIKFIEDQKQKSPVKTSKTFTVIIDDLNMFEDNAPF